MERMQAITVQEICAAPTVRRVGAMLDVDASKLSEGDCLPKGWHFILLAAQTARSELRSDGFPGLGVPMPDLGLPRLLLIERAVEYGGAIPIGSTVDRTSAVTSLTRKNDERGSRVIVSITHELHVAGQAEPAAKEIQTYMLLPGGAKYRAPQRDILTVEADHVQVMVPDATLLFQYSALGFNSHKIHLDREYAREVEGFPDLVVNGGLTALLFTEFARRHVGVEPRAIRVKYAAPLFAGRKMTLAATRAGTAWRLCAHDEAGHVAAACEMEVA